MTTDIDFALDTRIKELRKVTVGAFWQLVELLRTARKREIWKKMGYDSWAAYLAQPELAFRKHTVDNYITAFNRFEELGLPTRVLKLPQSKARLIAPHLTKENAEELIEKAQALSWSDLRAEVGIISGGEEPDETGRPAKPKFVWDDWHQMWGLPKAWREKIYWF